MKKISVQQIALAGVMLGLLTGIKFLDLVMIKTPLGYSWIEFYVPVLVIFALVLPFPISLLVSIAAPFIWFALGQTSQISPLSFFLDYSLPVLAMMLVYVARWIKKGMAQNIATVLIIIVAFVLKYFSHTLSGVVAWNTTWSISASMNAPYVFATMALTIVLVLTITPKLGALRKIVNKKGMTW